jgi:CRISPR-associated protein Csd1
VTVLQALDRYYDRMAARGEVVSPGWSTEPIGAVLELDADGTALRAIAWLDNAGKRPRPERVPKWFSRQGIGSTPFFLWDNAAYVFGLGDKESRKTARDHAAFRALHLAELDGDPDPGLAALRVFIERWSSDQPRPPGLDDRLLGFSIAFRMRGETRLLHNRPAAAIHVERLRTAGAAGAEGFCLVRGARLPLVRLHPKIKGVAGTAQAEVPLVSFEPSAFSSYGHLQGYNAPTSKVAADRYGAALNALLARDARTRLRVADATVAFWADASCLDAALAEHAARAAEDWFSSIETDAPRGATDDQQAASVRDALNVVAKGRGVAGLTPAILDRVAFHVLGLAPNAGRISVRYWIEGDFARFRDALDAHAAALAIEPRRWGERPPSVQRVLLKTTAVQEKFENVPNGLAGEVMRAVLTGAPYPRTWLIAAIIRLRAGDDPSGGWHAAAIKACLTRIEGEAPVPVRIDPDNPSVAYQLGRLFAVLEKAQYAALGRVNASIADRYYGSASSTPVRVFGSLMRGGRTHVSDARRRGKGLWIEGRLKEIVARLPPDLPRSLRLEDQGRFAIGYYHESAYRPAEAKADEQSPDDKDQA